MAEMEGEKRLPLNVKKRQKWRERTKRLSFIVRKWQKWRERRGCL
jgi:hypothetical protein